MIDEMQDEIDSKDNKISKMKEELNAKNCRIREMQKEKENSICIIVQLLKKSGIPIEEIQQNIAEQYHLTTEQAEQYCIKAIEIRNKEETEVQ